MPPKPKRPKLVTGVAKYSGQNRYPPPATKNEIISYKVMKPEGGINLDTAGIVKLRYRSSTTELVRFPEIPFYLKKKDLYDNPDKKTDANATAQEKADTHLTQASAIAPGVYLDPYLAGSCFFSKVEVKFDNQPVEISKVGEHGYLVQGVNRRYTTEDYSLRKYGTAFPRISTTEDRYCVKAAIDSATKAGKAALESMNYDSWQDVATVKPIVTNFSFDVFPFSFQSNVLAALTGETHENSWIRPDTEITIDLFRRHPSHS